MLGVSPKGMLDGAVVHTLAWDTEDLVSTPWVQDCLCDLGQVFLCSRMGTLNISMSPGLL